MTNRPPEKKITAKQLVTDQLSNEEPQNRVLSVTKGRGTASSWLTIKTSEAVRDYTKGWIEAHLVREGLVGRYYTDYGAGVDGYAVCAQWEVPR